jgi:predicted dehydrogenase
VKTAIVGLGPQGKRVVDVVKKLEGLELAAVIDLRQESLDALDAGPEVVRSKSSEAVFVEQGIELCCITTTGPSHASLAIAAMRAGVGRVMVEKPMACSVADSAKMIEVAAETGSRLAVNQSRRHDKFYRWLRDSVRSGRWGELRALWIQRPGIGLGCLGTHSFDLARFLSDRDVTRVTAWVDEPVGTNPRGAEFVDPGGLVVMELGRKVRAVISQIEDGAGPMSVELDLTGARVRVDEKYDRVEIIERDLSVKPGPDRPAVFKEAQLPEGISAKTNLQDMTRGLLRELMGTGEMDCDARHGLIAIEVLAAAHASAARGQVPVELPLSSQEDRERWLPVT